MRINHYQLVLLDLDGLLVDTEKIHYEAYKMMFSNRGVNMDWDFADYSRIALYSSTGLREAICSNYPALIAQVSSWDVLYAEKQKALLGLLREGKIDLMPGAEEFLSYLQKINIPRGVVTHSTREMVDLIKKPHPILQTIPQWVTREDYSLPKPNSECYLKAIAKMGRPNDRVVGFEDSPRGLKALMGSGAAPVLVCSHDYPEIPSLVEVGVVRFRSLHEVVG